MCNLFRALDKLTSTNFFNSWAHVWQRFFLNNPTHKWVNRLQFFIEKKRFLRKNYFNSFLTLFEADFLPVTSEKPVRSGTG